MNTKKTLMMAAILVGMVSNAQAYEITTAKIGASTAKVNGLIQGWSVGQSQQKTNEAQTAYRLRRAEMKIGGQVAEPVRYFFMADFAKAVKYDFSSTTQDTNPVQEFGLGGSLGLGFDLQAGQFKTPTSAEGLISSKELMFTERSLAGRSTGDKREMGAMLGWKNDYVKLSSMVSTGNAVTVNSSTKLTDLHLRAEYVPVKGASLGTFATMGDGFDYFRRGRLGVNGEYTFGDAVARAEVSQGRNQRTQFLGFDTEVGYFVTRDIQPVVRYEGFNPNRDKSIVGHAETIGVNYFVARPNAKIQATASALQNMTGNYGTPAFAPGQTNKEVTVALQAAI